MIDQADGFEELAPTRDGPRCNWHEGCDEPVSEDGLCAFHFDACERMEHADAQRDHEAQQHTAQFCAPDEAA